MITLTLPDGNKKEFETPITGRAVAESISSKTAKTAIAIDVDGQIKDLNTALEVDSQVRILTTRDVQALDILRHSTAHLLAQAVQRVYPGAHLGLGTAIEDGFYYDFEIPPVDREMLDKLEKIMQQIAEEDLAVTREVVSYEQARDMVKDQPFKIEVLDELENKQETVSFYRQGTFYDMCRGPHIPSTGKIPAFKLLKSGAVYWRGNAKNAPMQRIYGTAFFDQKAMRLYLKQLEEREKRDHNRLGRQLGYFITVPEVGQGLPLLAPKGAKLKMILQRFVEDEEEKRGYQFTMTPVMAKSDLYMISGHWQHYREGMFVLESYGEEIGLRPMTCPYQFMIYKSTRHSYRDLPIRYAETSTLFRNEASGEMHGLIRVRQFTLADGHIICRPDQLEEEFQKTLDLLIYITESIGLTGIWYRFSKWDPANKEKYIDNPEAWENSQAILKRCLDNNGLEYVEAMDEAAFYGPKLDMQIRNVYGKEDTVITLQFDFALPERFDMTYVDENNQMQRPFIIHRSSIGCYERTIAFLLEQYAGKLPFWISPEQAVVMTITSEIDDYARQVHDKLRERGIRVKADLRSDTINKKVRDAQTEYIPLMITVGQKEKDNGTVALRTLDGTVKYGIGLDAFLDYVSALQAKRALKIDLSELGG